MLSSLLFLCVSIYAFPPPQNCFRFSNSFTLSCLQCMPDYYLKNGSCHSCSDNHTLQQITQQCGHANLFSYGSNVDSKSSLQYFEKENLLNGQSTTPGQLSSLTNQEQFDRLSQAMSYPFYLGEKGCQKYSIVEKKCLICQTGYKLTQNQQSCCVDEILLSQSLRTQPIQKNSDMIFIHIAKEPDPVSIEKQKFIIASPQLDVAMSEGLGELVLPFKLSSEEGSIIELPSSQTDSGESTQPNQQSFSVMEEQGRKSTESFQKSELTVLETQKMNHCEAFREQICIKCQDGFMINSLLNQCLRLFHTAEISKQDRLMPQTSLFWSFKKQSDHSDQSNLEIMIDSLPKGEVYHCKKEKEKSQGCLQCEQDYYLNPQAGTCLTREIYRAFILSKFFDHSSL